MIVFDAVLALILAGLAWRCMAVRDLFQAIVTFIVLGLILALSWTRLGAPDLALAEAGIGAGLLGILLLSTWRVVRNAGPVQADTPAPSPLVKVSAAGASVFFGGLFAFSLHTIDVDSDRAGGLALDNLDAAGVEQPVTAVLLNFRSYDTLLEMGVLLMALIGAVLLRSPLVHHPAEEDTGTRSPLLPVLTSVFTPLALLMGTYLVWAGAHSPGGAFQGGAVLAGAGVMLLLGGRLGGEEQVSLLLRTLLILGAAVFTAFGLALMPLEGAFMAYPQGLVYPIMVTIEFTLALSIALTLMLLFTGTNGLRRAAP